MIVIWKIIRNFALEKFNKMPMKYRHNKVLHHLNSSISAFLKTAHANKCKEVKHDHIQRMPEIEKWAQDIYNFVARKFPTVAL